MSGIAGLYDDLRRMTMKQLGYASKGWWSICSTRSEKNPASSARSSTARTAA